MPRFGDGRINPAFWSGKRVFLMAPAAAYVGEFLATFEEFPPSQKPGSFTIGDAKQKILDTVGSP